MSKMYLVSREYDDSWSVPLMIFKTKEDIQKWAKDTYGIPYHEIEIDEDTDDSLSETYTTYADYHDDRFDKIEGKWIKDRRWSLSWTDYIEDISNKDISNYDQDSKYYFRGHESMVITLLDVFE